MRFLLLMFLTVSVYADTVKAVVGDWPPYHDLNNSQADKMTARVREVLSKEGMTLDVQFVPWARADKDVKNEAADISLSWIKTAQREQDFLFSKPIASTRTVLYSANNYKLSIKKIEDFAGLTIGVVHGYALPEEIEIAASRGLCQLDKAKTDQQNLKKLVKGRVDLIVIDENVAQYFIGNNYAYYKPQLTALSPFAWKSDLHIIISRSHVQADSLLEKINRAFAKGGQDLSFL